MNYLNSKKYLRNYFINKKFFTKFFFVVAFFLSFIAVLLYSRQLPEAFAANAPCTSTPPPAGAACGGEACGGAGNGSTGTCLPSDNAAAADPNKTSVCQGGSGSGLACSGGTTAAAPGQVAPPNNNGVACSVTITNTAPVPNTATTVKTPAATTTVTTNNSTTAKGTCEAGCGDELTAEPASFCTSGTCCATVAHLKLNAHLQAIGTGANADGTKENATPVQTTATGTLSFAQNQVQPVSATLTYNPKTGLYENNNFQVGDLGAGVYHMIFHVDKYLNRPVVTDQAGTTTIVPGVTAAPETLEMVPGDIAPAPQGDNIVDLQDYNNVIACMGTANIAMCPNPTAADLNSDGVVDQKDLDLLQSHFGAVGASFTTPQFLCTQDPNCTNGSSTIQLCPLQCKMQDVPANASVSTVPTK